MKTSIQSMGAAIALFATAGLVTSAAHAASPNGNWLRPKTGAVINVYNCSGGLGMKVVSSPKKSSVGAQLMCGADKVGKNKWKGELTSSEDGKTYTGYVTLTGSKLKLEGCVLGGLICKTEYWSRK